MFFNKKFFKISRFSLKSLNLLNIFFNFNFFFFEFLGANGYFKVFLKNIFFLKSNNSLKLFSLHLNYNYGFVYTIFFNILNCLIFKYVKKLLIFGVGYKVYIKGYYLHFYLSHSHPITYKIPKDIYLQVNSNEIIISGLNKQRVGRECLFLKNFKKPDSYKGKGLRYFDEKIFLKIIKKK